MMTKQLWRALNSPPITHPLFQRLLDERGRATWDHLRGALWTITGVLTLVMLMAMPIIFFIVVLMGPIVYALLNTLFYGSLWIVDIAGTVARELSHKTYELQCLMPVGTLGTNWIICTGRLHYKDTLGRSVTDIFAVVQLFMLTMMFIVIGILVTPPGEERVQLVHLLSIVLSLVAFIYIDHIQSIICGVFLALMAARQTRTVADARLWSLLCFLSLQFSWYIGLMLFSLLALPFLVQVLHLSHPLWGLVLPPMTAGLAFGGREWMIRVLWARVLVGTNADSYDLKLLERYG